MAYLKGFQYDIFISYAHVDNMTSFTQDRGWIEVFYQDLSIILAQRIGRLDAIKIWWDSKKLDGSVLFDQTIEEGIKHSAIMICLVSPGYVKSEYCKREFNTFYKEAQQKKAGLKVGEHSRILNVLLYNIPYKEWPPELAGTTGFPFHNADDPSDYGNPLEVADPRFRQQLRDLAEAIINLIKEMEVMKPAPHPPAVSSITIFFGDVNDSLRSVRKRIITELEKRDYTIICDVPPPFGKEEHDKAVKEKIQKVSLTVHMLDQYPGREIDDEENLWYPQQQVEVCLEFKTPQLIWVPAETDFETIEEEQYKSFIQKLESGKGLSKSVEFIRGAKSELTQQIIYLVEQLQEKERPASTLVEVEPDQANFKALNEGKLILVGRGEVGKTSLVNRLVYQNFRGDEEKTQGINITSWLLPVQSEKIKLHVWDFGGQEIMHATHQFFLTETSLYLLVINGREGGVDEDVDYWLKLIGAFGGNSPVIVVQNKINQHAFDLNYRELQNRYPQILAFVKTDCKENIGIDELHKQVLEAIDKMPDVRIELPASWFAVKHQLEALKENFIGYERLRNLCMRQGIFDEADIDKLSWILHRLGIVLNYRDDVRIRETNVLKPEWVTSGIYRILNAKILAEQKGELYVDDLEQLLPRDDYPPEKYFFLLELMRKFSLCFAFPDEQKSRYLIPELLGKEEPEEVQQFLLEECLCFEYHYSILPEGLLPRFIVRSHVLSRDQKRWRTGVILVHEGCKALVKAVISDKKVTILVKEEDAGARRRLLAIIRSDFDRIHNEFGERLIVSAKVPISGHKGFAVEYDKLILLEKGGYQESTEFDGQSLIIIKVKDLLNGIDLENQRSGTRQAITKSKAVFFSYSHKDESLRDELEVHLKLLQRQGVITTWHDRKIIPGTEWDHEINSHMEKADVILLLISADFIASDYCWEIEVKRAIERHNAGKSTVIPIVLRDCLWERALFGNFQGLPSNLLPVVDWESRDKAWKDVVLGIINALDKHLVER